MKKIISTITGALFLFAISLPTSIAKSAEFFSIGTGGPTGVYFQVGNAICKMVAKIQSAEHGRKKGTAKALRCSAPSTGGSTYNIGQIMQGELQFGVAQSDWQFHAYNGSSKFKDKGAPYAIAWAQHNKHGKPKKEAELDEGIKDWARNLTAAGIIVGAVAGLGSINNAIEKNKPLHLALEMKQLEILEEIESRETNKLRVQKELRNVVADHVSKHIHQ